MSDDGHGAGKVTLFWLLTLTTELLSDAVTVLLSPELAAASELAPDAVTVLLLPPLVRAVVPSPEPSPCCRPRQRRWRRHEDTCWSLYQPAWVTGSGAGAVVRASLVEAASPIGPAPLTMSKAPWSRTTT